MRDDKLRPKLADALKDSGRRVQLSVFECLIEEPQVASLDVTPGRARGRALRSNLLVLPGARSGDSTAIPDAPPPS